MATEISTLTDRLLSRVANEEPLPLEEELRLVRLVAKGREAAARFHARARSGRKLAKKLGKAGRDSSEPSSSQGSENRRASLRSTTWRSFRAIYGKTVGYLVSS